MNHQEASRGHMGFSAGTLKAPNSTAALEASASHGMRPKPLTSVVPRDRDPSAMLLCASTTALTVPVTIASNVSLTKPNEVS